MLDIYSYIYVEYLFLCLLLLRFLMSVRMPKRVLRSVCTHNYGKCWLYMGEFGQIPKNYFIFFPFSKKTLSMSQLPVKAKTCQKK
jgi:hypothetical protein